jgi:hypothetical protein
MFYFVKGEEGKSPNRGGSVFFETIDCPHRWRWIA